jgi:molecular chaperone GrpE
VERENPQPGSDADAPPVEAEAPESPESAVPESDAASEGEPEPTPAVDWQQVAEERYQQLLRLRADFENYRRRVDREREEWQGLVAQEIFGRLLGVFDSLDRALKSIPDTEDVAPWRTGIAMTHRTFLEVLKSQGVERIATVGEPFDPAVHEAIARSPDAAPEGTVLEELQAGFRWRDRVLRAALVRVSAGPPAAEPADGDAH